MNILGVICARGGSKRLPGKNIRTLNGKPLIAHSIICARESFRLTRFVVSTEDKRIADIAQAHGAKVTNRPPEMAKDDSPIIDALEHAASFYPCDLVVLLQATSPLRKASDIDDCIDYLMESYVPSVYTSDVYRWPRPNGCVYVAKPQWLFKHRSFEAEGSKSFIIPLDRSVDIDTLDDFKRAEEAFGKVL